VLIDGAMASITTAPKSKMLPKKTYDNNTAFKKDGK